MSYSVVICRVGVPASDSEAWQWIDPTIESFYDDQRERHPDFKQLHDVLTGRFPCICSLPDDKVDDGVWSDGPLIDNFGHDMAIIAFSFSSVEQVLPFVIESSNKLSMIVFDQQTNEIHRP